ncbi:RICIN domain-containing protein [Streptomyces sp. NPDC051907]|uniref:RICIN domain-containing protein n=1 Tax=Streptomyces sp. NPDC051907 TaxID=3155284 RepID=UPI00343CBA74
MPSRQTSVSRTVIAALGAAVCIALGITASPASAAPSTAAGATSTPAGAPPALGEIALTSASNGRNLDVQNGNTGNGVFIVTNSAPGHHQSWRVNSTGSDSSFTLVNNATGKCVDAGLPLRQQVCDGRASENWYFQPVTGAGQGVFMIRHKATNTCLDVVQNAQHNDAWTQNYRCNGTKAQQWVLPQTAREAAWNMAVDYAGARCAKDVSTCSWTKGSQAPAAPLPKVCVSPVWYNGTSAPVPWTFTLNTTTGWSSTIGFTLSSSLSGGAAPALQATVGTTVTGSVTMNLGQDLGNSLTVTVPQKQYGWVALSELATKVAGMWTFDAQGFAWSAQDTITVPLRNDDAGGASVYSAQTSEQFTGCNG